MKNLFLDMRGIWQKRAMIFELAKADFKKKFAGSYFGIVWMFIQPLVTIFIYFMIFSLFRDGNNDAYPFILWLIAGIIPWFFFNDGLLSATNSLFEYSYLVKKVVFQVNILPLIKIISALFIHLIFIGILLAFYLIYGFYPTVYWLQAIYYTAAAVFLAIGCSYITSAIYVFFKDMGQLVSIVLQFGMWVTPIMWEFQMVQNPIAQKLLRLNPMFYVTQGYREAFLENKWFWESPAYTAYFWVFAILVFLIGNSIFHRLRPHFADVL